MGARGDKSVGALGFVTVCELSGRGLVGGYLLLDAGGRPLEFHCTAPVVASRAQEILYGPTLRPFLYGEQIGKALLEKSSIKPAAVFVDLEAVLAAQAFVDAPLALVFAGEEGEVATDANAARFRRFRINGRTLATPATRPDDETTIVERLNSLAATFDLAEPFERIREAIAEAHRDAKTRSPSAPPTVAAESGAEAA